MEPDDEADLKIAINQFLWERLPGGVTLNEAEADAVRIYEILQPRYARRYEAGKRDEQ